MVVVFVSCKQENDNPPKNTNPILKAEGYILTFQIDSKVWDEVNGYTFLGLYFVSIDFKDTLLTYNFPKKMFDIPSSYYLNCPFPDSARYEFKVEIEYQIAINEEQVTHFLGAGLVPHPCRLCNNGCTQIIIKSAKPLN